MRLRSLIFTCLVFLIPLVIAAPASAEVTRAFEASFVGAEAPEGPFTVISSVAVDISDDVYVAGWGSVLDASGNYVSVVDKFDASGGYAGVQITGADTPQPSFSVFNPSDGHEGGIAVDGSGSADKGDLYVADVENNVIDRFSSSGVFECQITGKKPVSGEEIAHECNGAAGSLTPDGSFEPTGVAVSSTTGNAYVADSEHDVIDEFKPSGEYAGQISSPELSLGGAAPIALDSSGDLYVINQNYFTMSFGVVDFNPKGEFVKVLDSGGKPSSVAVDPSTGDVDVYAETEGQIAEYEPGTGALLGHFGAGHFGTSAVEIAAGPTGKLYAGEHSGQPPAVSIFGPEIVVPAATTGTATGVGQSTATLNGEVEPDAAHGGETTECEFEYVTEAQYKEHSYEGAATSPCEPPASTPYKAPTNVTANITVTPDTTYHFRLRAANTNAVPMYGKDETLTTYGPPAIDSESATELTISTMRLEARIDPFGYDTTCEQVQYVDATEFQQLRLCERDDAGVCAGGPRLRLRRPERERDAQRPAARHDLPLPLHRHQPVRHDNRRRSDARDVRPRIVLVRRLLDPGRRPCRCDRQLPPEHLVRPLRRAGGGREPEGSPDGIAAGADRQPKRDAEVLPLPRRTEGMQPRRAGRCDHGTHERGTR